MHARLRWLEALSMTMGILAVAALAGCAAHSPSATNAGSTTAGSTAEDSTTGSEGTSMHTPMYLALGDSYTIGEGVDEPSRWPWRLAKGLRDAGIDIHTTPGMVARTGWTTDELSTAIDAAEPPDDYGLVSLSIGVNNQYRGLDVDDYRKEFSALLQRAIGFAGGNPGHVIVLSIPDWGVTPFGQASGRDTAQIALELDAYNAAAREICAERGVAFVDITPISREHGADPAMLAGDGLHPSGAMYALWTQQALPVALRLLSGQ